MRHKARTLAALMLLPMLGGCVAAAALAVPSMTALGVIEKGKRDKRERSEAAPSAAAEAAASVPDRSWELTPLTQLPANAGPTSPGVPARPWQDFLDYALASAGEGDGRESAILAPEAAQLLLPRQEPCERGERAVIIDLDHGAKAFSPDAELEPSPGLATGLARLREAGVVVMWISQLDANRVDDVARALMRSGLDPTGRDPILLVLGDGDRKQALREQAARSACVLAIAGDRREDFDELFGYLRDPATASNFDALIGSGWFLVPDALSAAANEAQPAG